MLEDLANLSWPSSVGENGIIKINFVGRKFKSISTLLRILGRLTDVFACDSTKKLSGKSESGERLKWTTQHSRFHNHCQRQKQQPKLPQSSCLLFSATAFFAFRPSWHSMCYLMTGFPSCLMIYCRDCYYCLRWSIVSYWFGCSMALTALEDWSFCWLNFGWCRSDCSALLDTLDDDNGSFAVKKGCQVFEATDPPCVVDIDT